MKGFDTGKDANLYEMFKLTYNNMWQYRIHCHHMPLITNIHYMYYNIHFMYCKRCLFLNNNSFCNIFFQFNSLTHTYIFDHSYDGKTFFFTRYLVNDDQFSLFLNYNYTWKGQFPIETSVFFQQRPFGHVICLHWL